MLCLPALAAAQAPGATEFAPPSPWRSRLADPDRRRSLRRRWKEAAKVETWYETNVGDNVPPPVQTIAKARHEYYDHYNEIRDTLPKVVGTLPRQD